MRKYTLHQNVIRGEEAETRGEDVGKEVETRSEDVEKEAVTVD